LLKLKEKNLIYKKQYEGLYCVGCEKFLSEKDLKCGKCPDHPNKEITHHSEENWFFKLSEFQQPLLDAITNKDYEILPISRKNEIVSKLKMGVEDISISRAGVKWGIPLPWDKSQTVYVWVDALLNYLSALKINKKLDFWPADIHLMAKDILWFHAVIWPALLLATGEKLPKKVFVHGFFTINGQKMSKTIGNVIDPNVWVKKYGADAVRYYLLTAFPFGEDGNVSEQDLENKYNNELANDLGNLVNRVIVMVNKYHISKINFQTSFSTQKPNSKISELIENLKFDEALKEIWKNIKAANNYIEQNKPWELAKTDLKKLQEVLRELYGQLSIISYQLSVILPSTSAKIESQLQTLNPEPLFPRIK
jgi:methionyl-tRNA synthetase